MPETFDSQIHAEIERLDVPGPSVDFFARLEQRVAEAPAPNVITLQRRRSVRTALFATPIAAAVIAVALFAGTLNPQSNNTAPKLTLASAVIARVNAAFQTTNRISGTIETTGGLPGAQPVSFAIDSAGNYTVINGDGTNRRYQASTGKLYTCKMTPFTCKLTDSGYVAGQQETYVTELYSLDVVRSLATDANAQLTDATFDGKAAWKITTTRPQDAVLPGGPYEEVYLIDKKSGFVLSYSHVQLQSGQAEYTAAVHDFKTDSHVSKDLFKINDDGSQPAQTFGDFRRTTVDQVAAGTGYAAFQSTNALKGYALSEVSVGSRQADELGPKSTTTGTAVSTYRKGISSFSIVSQKAPNNNGASGDPVFESQGPVIIRQDGVTLASGSFSGKVAHVVISDRDVHLWVANDGFVVGIYGNVDETSLLDIANDLHQ